MVAEHPIDTLLFKFFTQPAQQDGSFARSPGEDGCSARVATPATSRAHGGVRTTNGGAGTRHA